ncbi:acyl-CoA dehydrogenase family protein [Streptomyces sp. DSM 42041]|uniref:Acyl-CoA dehydrogenase family protein n=1 Tax=Streptomyces hazeniae TaxID=3075538 RepID=A0ABU2NYR6_9ACTN|nr:acyl-CoA dehydrogenase family protein [Streptomyces sp. DSM 42041]MDT0382140.1 acyl-CoA dehydrogenase family protein [Streptomyces sp. DSM 42041]
MTAPGFGAELFLGRLRADLLSLPEGDPRRLDTNEEQFLSSLREFCANKIDSTLIEREDCIPDEVIEGLKDIGAFCIKIPREYGGLGLSGLCYLRALMLVSSVHSSLGELLAAHQAIGLPQPLVLFGTEEQKRAFLPRCSREISAFTLTEADIGNDPFRMHTTAVPDYESDTYTLNGVKLWVTNGVLADLLVVMAMVPPSGTGDGGMTAFVVEADSPGVTIEHRSSFLGLRGLENGVIRLHNVAVPAGNRIGKEGEGLDVALTAQDTGRLSLPAACAAAAKWSLMIARQWTSTRVQWDRPIGEQEAVAGKLSYIASTAFALEAMVEVTGHHADAGKSDTRLDAELAKLFASEKAWLVADELMQLRGGRGYETAESAAERGERGVPVEQLMRDLRIGRIFDGSSEALKTFIASAVTESMHSTAEPVAPPPAAGDDHTHAVADEAPTGLVTHLDFAYSAARRLGDLVGELAGLPEAAPPDDRQRDWGRLVDIAAELYAMSVSCTYATALTAHGDTPVQLADVFCAQAKRRVTTLFDQLVNNTDARDRVAARHTLDGHYTWLEEGIIDASVDGPWIAQPKPGPATVPNLRRAVPAQPRRRNAGGTR